jgi:hypothetical protein
MEFSTMSKRDKALLETAGLSIADAASLFNRTRQALYQGLSQERHYFSARDALVVLHDARRHDSDRLEELMRFIDANFQEPENRFVLPPDPTIEQLNRVLSEADKIALMFNGNIDHLSSKAAFSKVLRDLLGKRENRIVELFVPGEWVLSYIKENLGVEIQKSGVAPRILQREEVSFLPSMVITEQKEQKGAFRAFIFGRISIEELPTAEAGGLFKHFDAKPN